MNKQYMLLVLLLFVGLPLLFCLVFKVLPLGSVGPFIPLTGIINVFVLPFLVHKSFVGLFKTKGGKIVCAITSVAIGVFIAVLGMNFFIGVSLFFGIKDYQLM